MDFSNVCIYYKNNDLFRDVYFLHSLVSGSPDELTHSPLRKKQDSRHYIYPDLKKFELYLKMMSLQVYQPLVIWNHPTTLENIGLKARKLKEQKKKR